MDLKNIQHISQNNLNELDSLKQIVTVLLNTVEQMQQTITDLKTENQDLKDEINRLKGEQPKPKFTSAKKSGDISSTKQSNQKKAHKKEPKKAIIKIDKKVSCKLDPSELPPDAVFKGRKTLIQQDIVFERMNTEFTIDIWYSPSQKKTYRAKADNYTGYFGHTLKAYILNMHRYANVTRSKLLGLLRGMGIEISEGSLNNVLFEKSEIWIDEKHDILKSGLQNSYIQTDTTGAKVAGKSYHTHILCSEDFMTFSTLPGKSRKHLLHALQGEPKDGLSLIYNKITQKYLDYFKISKQHQTKLIEIYKNQPPIFYSDFRTKTSELIPDLATKKTTFNWVCDAFAFGFYEAQNAFPPVEILVSDNAPEYKLIGKEQALCWIHDARYYNKLTPFFDCHRELLEEFKNRYWKFYRRLSAYKEKPDDKEKLETELEFDKLFIPETGYFDLDKQIKRSLKNKAKLLTVLKHPQVPLHNNQSELGARHQVRKRDVCLHTMTDMGTQIQDAMMSIIYTCNLLGVNAFAYIRERIRGNTDIYLPNLLLQKINSKYQA